MSAILSADDLNDFINPGVACIKPVETLPLAQQQPPPADDANADPYEVTTEEQVSSGTIAPPAHISLTDCLACSGCVTSAEAILVSLQSHAEVLDTLDNHHEMKVPGAASSASCANTESGGCCGNGKIFVASVSPQARASLAATYQVSERDAGLMISQLLSGPWGVRSAGKHNSGFAWVIDTNAMREASLVAAADEVDQLQDGQKKPVITSACPGWICYAEKTHSHILPHLSRLKSPQALTGVLVKSVLAKRYGIDPKNVWHLSIMPCFDKKLEASRSELTSHAWHGQDGATVRDVDCVITARELLMLAESRGISFPGLPKHPVADLAPFPDSKMNEFLIGQSRGQKRKRHDATAVGTSGSYLWHVLKTQQSRHTGSQIKVQRGRNQDVFEYSVVSVYGVAVFKAARYYGFRNIQNLVRKLKPAKASRLPGALHAGRKVGGTRRTGGGTKAGDDAQDYAYVEVMACPGGCTNRGGQIKVGDVATLRQVADGTDVQNGGLQEMIPAPREWLAKVDEAYWSGGTSSSDLEPDGDGQHSPARDSVMSGTSDDNDSDVIDGISRRHVHDILHHWTTITGVDQSTLLTTTYRVVESDVGKDKPGADVDRVNALAAAAGGGW